MDWFIAVMTFSATVSLLNRRMFWNVLAMPAFDSCTVVFFAVDSPLR